MMKFISWFEEWIHKGSISPFLMWGKLLLISNEESNCPIIENVRPITVLSTVTKFFESSKMHNLKEIVSNSSFSKAQRGFTNGKSIMDNKRDVLNAVYISLKAKWWSMTPLLSYFFS